ncbi:MAG: DUF86 domain-containing protein [Phycisphaerales bacterium]|nr:DUF86 domain-containing protein [Phycisphaerales bacterium]
MPHEHGENASLYDMLYAAERTLRMIAGQSRRDYDNNEMLRLAVERSIEIIGEAARRLPQSFRDAHPQIAWRAIMATRHILAHDYDEVNNDTVWRILTDHIQPLISQLKLLIPPPPPMDP